MEGFTEKNRDTVLEEHVDILKASQVSNWMDGWKDNLGLKTFVLFIDFSLMSFINSSIFIYFFSFILPLPLSFHSSISMSWWRNCLKTAHQSVLPSRRKRVIMMMIISTRSFIHPSIFPSITPCINLLNHRLTTPFVKQSIS